MLPVIAPIAQVVTEGLALLGQHENEIAGGVIMAHGAGIGVRWVNSAVRAFLPLLQRRYVGTSRAAQVAAGNNIVAVSERIRTTIDEYVASGSLTEDQGRAALDDPAFALLFNDRLLDASETDDPLVHESFAKMVVEHMTRTSGTSEAVLIGMASARLRELGSRQLRLLGAIFVAEHIEVVPFVSLGSVEADVQFYKEQCEVEVRPFWDIPILAQDVEHLDATNLIELSEERLHRRVLGGGRGSPMLSHAFALNPYQLSGIELPDVFRKLGSWMENPERSLSFKYITLKNPGWIIGAVVYSHLRGVPLDLGRWE